MHCGRRLLPSGIRLLCGRQQQLLGASSHVVKSSLPDVEIPSTAVPDYVWQRVDQWPDKVAIVSMQRVKAVIIVHTLPEVTSPQTASDARMFPETTKRPYCWSTKHFWKSNVTVLK